MNLFMLMWWLMFRELIPHVLTSWFPVYEEILLFYPVLHPIKLYFHFLGTFLSDRSCDNNFGSRVICFDWGWWLGEKEFTERAVEG